VDRFGFDFVERALGALLGEAGDAQRDDQSESYCTRHGQ
jgi:hypothetical protein